MDYVFLYGLLGLGKIILVNIIVKEMGGDLKVILGLVIERVGDLVVILIILKDYDVLFIDEIYRLNRNVEEILYFVMEDYVLDIVIGKGVVVKFIRIDFFKFIFIGVIIRIGMFIFLFRDRFGVFCVMEYYINNEFKEIVVRSVVVFGCKIIEEGVFEIVRRFRGILRIVNRLFKRVRDYLEVKFDKLILLKEVKVVLELLEVDN